MATNRYNAEKRRIEREIERLRRQAEALQQKQRKPIIDQIVRDMKAHDISLEELTQAFTKGQPGRKKSSKAVKAPTSRTPVAPKYKNPDTGETWTGRGKAPRWITAAEAEGWNREDFLIVSQESKSGAEPSSPEDSSESA